MKLHSAPMRTVSSLSRQTHIKRDAYNHGSSALVSQVRQEKSGLIHIKLHCGSSNSSLLIRINTLSFNIMYMGMLQYSLDKQRYQLHVAAMSKTRPGLLICRSFLNFKRIRVHLVLMQNSMSYELALCLGSKSYSLMPYLTYFKGCVLPILPHWTPPNVLSIMSIHT